MSTTKNILTESLGALDANRRYTIAQTLLYLGTSRATLYKFIKAPKDDPRALAVIKDGRRSYVYGRELIRRSAVGAS
jgi:hypothetical protein